MAIENIIARGVGFTPISVRFIVTHGMDTASISVVVSSGTLTIASAAPAIVRTQGQDMTDGATLKGRSDVVRLKGVL